MKHWPRSSKRLATAGVLMSHHGIKGGYTLAGDPRYISVDVIKASEGPRRSGIHVEHGRHLESVTESISASPQIPRARSTPCGQMGRGRNRSWTAWARVERLEKRAWRKQTPGPGVKDRAKVNGILKSQLRKCVFARHALAKPLGFHFWTPCPLFKENDTCKIRVGASILVDPFFARGLAICHDEISLPNRVPNQMQNQHSSLRGFFAHDQRKAYAAYC